MPLIPNIYLLLQRPTLKRFYGVFHSISKQSMYISTLHYLLNFALPFDLFASYMSAMSENSPRHPQADIPPPAQVHAGMYTRAQVYPEINHPPPSVGIMNDTRLWKHYLPRYAVGKNNKEDVFQTITTNSSIWVVGFQILELQMRCAIWNFEMFGTFQTLWGRF